MDDDVLIRVRRILEDSDPVKHAFLATIFDRELPVPRGEIESWVGAAELQCLLDVDLIRLVDGSYEPVSRVDRVGRLLIASDLRRRRWQSDYVVGPGAASFLLAKYLVRAGSGEALDLGCGSGILSLILASAAVSVVAVDINSRAIAFARFNAALNGFRVVAPELGDFLSDIADPRFDGRFDIVVSNPPFVLAPAHRLVYRDRPLPGDAVSARTLERVGRALAPGGRGYVLCNWIDRGDGTWSDAVRRWIEPSGVDAIVVHVGDHSPAEYSAAWNRDLGSTDRVTAIAKWTDALAAEGVRRIQAGVIAMGRATDPTRRPPRFKAVDKDDRVVTRQAVDDFLAGSASDDGGVATAREA